MSTAFLNAAASYFGINPDQMRSADWVNDGGKIVVTFDFAVNDGDIIGILERLKAQQQTTQGAGGRKVVHVDTPAPAQAELPDVMWIDSDLLSDHQRQMASDTRDVKGQTIMLIQSMMLDEVQRTKGIKVTGDTKTWDQAVAKYGPDYDSKSPNEQALWGSRGNYVRYRFELDGSVTSNSDDFGGFPG